MLDGAAVNRGDKDSRVNSPFHEITKPLRQSSDRNKAMPIPVHWWIFTHKRRFERQEGVDESGTLVIGFLGRL